VRQADRATESFGVDEYADYRDSDASVQIHGVLGGRVTHVIDAVGSKGSLVTARSLLSPGTAFGCYGIDDITETGDTLREMSAGRPVLEMGTREWEVVDEWYALWKDGFFNRLGMCDQVLPLDEINQALEMVMRREAVKIVIEM
jgi:threonine dehydrogenase-like Zn-dependent dehydrogenase